MTLPSFRRFLGVSLMVEPAHPGVHHCRCQDCERCPQSTIAEEHRLINQLVATFDEKSRRLYVAFLARQEGRGGIAKLARITGLSRNTIRRGWQELLHPSPDSEGRIRHKGGGRMRLEKKRHSHPAGPGRVVAGCHGRRSDVETEVDTQVAP